jgi:hypothetical protein
MSRNLFLAPTLAAPTVAALVAVGLAGCIHVHIDPIEVAPINIYAKLDADVRVKLDEDVKSLAQKNPDLF